MSKRYSGTTIEHLASWVLKEYDESQQIFGIHKDLFFTPDKNQAFTMERYGQFLETPIGVAAGPHTLRAQNLVAAWLCGARYFELGTVQTNEKLGLDRPSIDARGLVYSSVSSQELSLDESYNEYLKAWILLHVLRHKFGWSNENDPGFIFNMTLGCSLEGIQKYNVQKFLDKMENSKEALEEKLNLVRKLYPKVDEIHIPTRLSNNVTLVAAEGVPSEEVEAMLMYLIQQRGYHTTLKLNPSLLGSKHLRHILNNKLDFNGIVSDEIFENNLEYSQGVKIIENALVAAKEKSVDFGIKLTQGLKITGYKGTLLEDKGNVYMSGAPLHPIGVTLGAKLQNHFNGELDVSFSAGADCFNVHQILACGFKPITIASDLLRPGGYARQLQVLSNLKEAMAKEKAKNISDYILKYSNANKEKPKEAALINLRRYAGAVGENLRYNCNAMGNSSIKTQRELTMFDCVEAPCILACPIAQDVPSFIHHVSKGKFKEAYQVIARNNPLPNILAMFCSHPCQRKCTRINYDNSLAIREIERFVVIKSGARPTLTPSKNIGKKVAIIGGGPSGLAAAYLLRLEGFQVEIFEAESFVGGTVAKQLSSFKFASEAIHEDVEYIVKLGIKIVSSHRVDGKRFEELKKTRDYVYIAVGKKEEALKLIKPELFAIDLDTGMTKINNVFAGGGAVANDCDLIEAVGHGQKVAINIISKAGRNADVKAEPINKGLSNSEFMKKAATKVKGISLPEIELKGGVGVRVVERELTEKEAKAEAERCLYCSDFCDACVSVCPNRANISYMVQTGEYIIQKSDSMGGKIKIETEKPFVITQEKQVLTIGDFCNQCGNCSTFCPTAGDPCKAKPKFYLTEESFKAEENAYRIEGNVLKARVDGRRLFLEEKEDALHYKDGAIYARLNLKTFEVMNVEPKNGAPSVYSFEEALKMAILYNGVKNLPFNK